MALAQPLPFSSTRTAAERGRMVGIVVVARQPQESGHSYQTDLHTLSRSARARRYHASDKAFINHMIIPVER